MSGKTPTSLEASAVVPKGPLQPLEQRSCMNKKTTKSERDLAKLAGSVGKRFKHRDGWWITLREVHFRETSATAIFTIGKTGPRNWLYASRFLELFTEIDEQ
jgi:hypothetical protein